LWCHTFAISWHFAIFISWHIHPVAVFLLIAPCQQGLWLVITSNCRAEPNRSHVQYGLLARPWQKLAVLFLCESTTQVVELLMAAKSFSFGVRLVARTPATSDCMSCLLTASPCSLSLREKNNPFRWFSLKLPQLGHRTRNKRTNHKRTNGMPHMIAVAFHVKCQSCHVQKIHTQNIWCHNV